VFTSTDRRDAYAISSPLLIFLRTSYTLFLHHVLHVLHIFITGARFGYRAHFLRSGTRSVRKDKRIIIRVVGPHGRWISPPTNWTDCSALTLARRSLRRPLVGWTTRCSPTSWLDCSGLSCNEGSSAKLATPGDSDSSYKAHQLSWGLLDVRIVRRFIAS